MKVHLDIKHFHFWNLSSFSSARLSLSLSSRPQTPLSFSFIATTTSRFPNHHSTVGKLFSLLWENLFRFHFKTLFPPKIPQITLERWNFKNDFEFFFFRALLCCPNDDVTKYQIVEKLFFLLERKHLIISIFFSVSKLFISIWTIACCHNSRAQKNKGE